MGRLVRRGLIVITLALAFAGVAAVYASAAGAAPVVTTPEIQAKQAQERAARAEFESNRVALDMKTAEFMGLARQLERTRGEISEVATQLAASEVKLAAARSALTSRAVELYRAPRVGMVEIMVGTNSIQDLFARARYLAIISDHDARLIRDYRKTQSEFLFLRQDLASREANLVKLQQDADVQLKQIRTEMKTQQARAKALGTEVARLVAEASRPVLIGGEPTVAFQQETVISQANFRDASSMSAAAIQQFLNGQPGKLKEYFGPDHTGAQKTAAQMIAEASVAFNVNPKVILATLQKEQSLLTEENPSDSQYNGAMGAGMPDSRNNDESMQGFGNQIWWGAEKQNKNALLWHQGASEMVDDTRVYATNEGTHAQYRYTPHFDGVKLFWLIYWRYFGNPLS